VTYKLYADLLVVFHLVYILFVIFGGFLARRQRWIIWVHIPCAIWGMFIEFAGWICPLTPLENEWRIAAGSSGYSGGFIENYIIPFVYPEGLTRVAQIVLGMGVIMVNGLAYRHLWLHRARMQIKI
jgi:hypothetical protein